MVRKHHRHDCDECKYLGSEVLETGGVDYYFCPRERTLIARYGRGGEYISGAAMYPHMYLINRAGNLALEQGHITIDDLRKAINKPNLRHTVLKPH